jgi:hypothetical protein
MVPQFLSDVKKNAMGFSAGNCYNRQGPTGGVRVATPAGYFDAKETWADFAEGTFFAKSAGSAAARLTTCKGGKFFPAPRLTTTAGSSKSLWKMPTGESANSSLPK